MRLGVDGDDEPQTAEGSIVASDDDNAVTEGGTDAVALGEGGGEAVAFPEGDLVGDHAQPHVSLGDGVLSHLGREGLQRGRLLGCGALTRLVHEALLVVRKIARVATGFPHECLVAAETLQGGGAVAVADALEETGELVPVRHEDVEGVGGEEEMLRIGGLGLLQRAQRAAERTVGQREHFVLGGANGVAHAALDVAYDSRGEREGTGNHAVNVEESDADVPLAIVLFAVHGVVAGDLEDAADRETERPPQLLHRVPSLGLLRPQGAATNVYVLRDGLQEDFGGAVLDLEDLGDSAEEREPVEDVVSEEDDVGSGLQTLGERFSGGSMDTGNRQKFYAFMRNQRVNLRFYKLYTFSIHRTERIKY